MARTLVDLMRELSPPSGRRSGPNNPFYLRSVEEICAITHLSAQEKKRALLGTEERNHQVDGEARLMVQLGNTYPQLWPTLKAEAELMLPDHDPLVSLRDIDDQDPFDEPVAEPHQMVYWFDGTFMGQDRHSQLPELMRPVRCSGINLNSLDGLHAAIGADDKLRFRWSNVVCEAVGAPSQELCRRTTTLINGQNRRLSMESYDCPGGQYSIAIHDATSLRDKPLSLPVICYSQEITGRQSVKRTACSAVVARHPIGSSSAWTQPFLIGAVWEQRDGQITQLLTWVDPLHSHLWMMALTEARLLPHNEEVTVTRWFGTIAQASPEWHKAQASAIILSGTGQQAPYTKKHQQKAGQTMGQMMTLLHRDQVRDLSPTGLLRLGQIFDPDPKRQITDLLLQPIAD